ncbi:probable WRKY transcription factor 3 [Phtheirospermum japonicum]|uniref:Probable WRKY transcription factor 3 n=1 Tax=Phtheirospermum japonicum TaxID=374723 RepID=A0A830BNU5_9LAMI|nr:probable WRKY transcription factor 3 [Phtheirospermum japonicum]
MAENKPPPPPSSCKPPPEITLPPRTSIENMFTIGPGVSPGPMTLVSSFFAENDPDNDCRSFAQLLSGAMSPPSAAPSARQNFEPTAEAGGGGGGSGSGEFRFQQNRPAGLVVSQQPGMFTIPPGLSPASLLDSPGFFSSTQGMMEWKMEGISLFRSNSAFMERGKGPLMSHQQILAQMQLQYTLPSGAPPQQQQQQQIPPPLPDPKISKESSDISHSDQKSQPSFYAVDKPADDGYNWRKYGQKHVKGSEFPRSYYKCTHPNCPVKKKVERSLDGQITEIIYKGQHNHPPPSKRSGNANGTAIPQGNLEFGSEGQFGNFGKEDGGRDQGSSQVTPERISGSSDSEEVGNGETRLGGRDEDEPESKRRNVEVQSSEQASSRCTVTEPRIIVQTTSEVDLLDDGYRWRKYGQKVVKGNPYPRSYYKCTTAGCNVRKHVERAASDPKAVITTYEGKHNHDVPASRNSSHNTALRPQNQTVDRPLPNRGMGFGRNEQQQPVALLRFKEEQIT